MIVGVIMKENIVKKSEDKLEKIETRDGSVTFYNPVFGDSYHSKSIGALEEAETKYVNPIFEELALTKRKKDSSLKVLDFCFGLGYNTVCLIKKLKEVSLKGEIVGVENDKEILDQILKIRFPDSFEHYAEPVITALSDDSLRYSDELLFLEIFMDDGRSKIEELESSSFDAVMFDPFSPSKHAEMWSYEVFSQMYRIIKRGGVLTTYSCASWVRRNMKEAGFVVKDGPIIGRRSPSTIAIKE